MVRVMKAQTAKFGLGQVVKHRKFSFRGVIFDIDPEFNNTDEWLMSIPEEVRPRKDQPFYHLFAETRKQSTSPMSPSRTCLRIIRANRCAIHRSARCLRGGAMVPTR